jgi:hypothetical protein
MALGWTLGSATQQGTVPTMERHNNKQQLLSVVTNNMDGPKIMTNMKWTAMTTTTDTTANNNNHNNLFMDPNNSTSNHDGPMIIWLMSFPNSGTSFTSRLVRHVTHLSTASNYGLESIDPATNSSVPIYRHGPYWTDVTVNTSNPYPAKYVLTKTHCGGKCDVCGPSHWLENTHSFKVACLSGTGMVHGRRVEVRYDEALVKKAVHLIRNPFDNGMLHVCIHFCGCVHICHFVSFGCAQHLFCFYRCCLSAN